MFTFNEDAVHIFRVDFDDVDEAGGAEADGGDEEMIGIGAQEGDDELNEAIEKLDVGIALAFSEILFKTVISGHPDGGGQEREPDDNEVKNECESIATGMKVLHCYR